MGTLWATTEVLLRVSRGEYLRPSQGDTAVAKDVFLLGTGISLVVDAALNESPITATD